MRPDAANLLARLGRRDFRYREFTDNFADMELWPIFEALLTDERIVGKPLSALAARNEDIIPAAKAPSVPQAEQKLFDRYAKEQPAPPRTSSNELRSFLRQLSKDDAGERD